MHTVTDQTAAKPSRSVSIDAFRGLTIVLMVFVNALAGVRGIPSWMEHMPGDQDGMTFVDVIFPAFLFIVGMSIPFADNQRTTSGLWPRHRHVIQRTVALLVMGVFMVNAEEGYNEAAMGMSIAVWCLASYACFLLVWLDYRQCNVVAKNILRVVGLIGLLILGVCYRAGPHGEFGMRPQWWGILGLIGWAYFYTNIIDQLTRRRLVWLLVALVVCMLYAALGEYQQEQVPSLWWAQAQNAAHTSITLTGLICARIFSSPASLRQRLLQAVALVLALGLAGGLLHQVMIISKNQATPPWCLFSAAICVMLFALLYWMIDVRGWVAWTRLVRPVAVNPLLIYLVPFIVYAFARLLHLAPLPVFEAGIPGIIWCAGYAVLIVVISEVLNRLRIRLQL